MFSLEQRQKKERSKLKQSYPFKKDFGKETKALMSAAINESEQRQKEIKGTQSRLELIDKVSAYSNALQTAIENSPVSKYLKFSQALVGGVKFTELTRDLLAGLREYGFSNRLDLITLII